MDFRRFYADNSRQTPFSGGPPRDRLPDQGYPKLKLIANHYNTLSFVDVLFLIYILNKML